MTKLVPDGIEKVDRSEVKGSTYIAAEEWSHFHSTCLLRLKAFLRHD